MDHILLNNVIINDTNTYEIINSLSDNKNSSLYDSTDEYNDIDELSSELDNLSILEELEELEYFEEDEKQDKQYKITKKSIKQDYILDYENIDIEDYEKYNDLIEIIYETSNNNINIKKKIYCENCQDDDVVEDTSQGIIVCKKCGQVISTLLDSNPEWTQYNDDSKKDMNRCSHPISQLLPQSSTATTIGGSCSSRIKTLHGWSAMPYKERSLNDVFKILQAKCNDAKILKCIEDDAKIMYKNISDCKHITGKNKGKPIIIRGKNRTSVIAACILYACRKKDKTRSPKEIAELFGLRYTEITKGCKIFNKLAKLKKMEFKFNFTKPEHFITRFCEELKIKNEYSIQAIQISNNVQKIQIASVHTPLSLATGSIYLMIYLNNLNIQKKTIAEKFNVSQVTIAKAFKKLEPFINLLTNDKICDKLSVEIKKYQDNISIYEVLKPKFMRFNIDIQKTMKLHPIAIYGILENNIQNKQYILNEKLITEHTIEYENKNKQFDNEFIRLNFHLMNTMYKYII
jgi:transcription initiation factor TFIIIB Brf1 subunit/transcription initiation factor TFIIB